MITSWEEDEDLVGPGVGDKESARRKKTDAVMCTRSADRKAGTGTSKTKTGMHNLE
jgi:hypothetical protein